MRKGNEINVANTKMAASIWKLALLLTISVLFYLQWMPVQAKKSESSNLIDDLSDIKDFKKLLRTKTNILVLFAKSAAAAGEMLITFKSVADTIRGEGTLVFVDCSGDSRKVCKKLKISPETYVLKHYKDGEFHKNYDRKETLQSMVTFMRNPTGDIPWEEDDTSGDVHHIMDTLALEKLLNKESKPVLIMFYAPWCGFCKRLKPGYAEAATEVKPLAILAAMDVTKPENSAVRSHFNITGFPTLMYFERGRLKTVYDGENSKDGIVQFIKNPSQPKPKAQDVDWSETAKDIVHLTDATFDEVLAKEPSVMVMFYAPWCGHCKAMKPEYETAAKTLKDENIPGILAAVDATKEQAVASKFAVKGYPTVKYFKSSEFAFDLSLRTADKIVEFMKEPKEPPPPPPPETPWHETESSVHHLNDDNFKQFLKKKKHALVMFYAPWCGHCKRAKPEFEKAADQFQNDLQIAFAAVDCTVQTAVCNMFEVQGFPTIKYFNYFKNSTVYDGERTEANFVAFMKNPQNPVASTSDAQEDFWSSVKGSEALVHLTSSTFDQVTKEANSVLVLFYAPWCGHCKAIKPAYAEAAATLKLEKPDAVLATLDATAERALATKYGITGYPSIKYLSKGVFVADFNMQRTAKDLVKFMKSPPKSKDEL